MKKNMGNIDKAIRILIALALVVLYFTGIISGTVGIILLVVAGIFILTSIFGICPAYMPLGIKTTKKE